MSDDHLNRLAFFPNHFAATSDGEYPTEESLFMEQDKISHVKDDGTESLDEPKFSEQIDDQQNGNSSLHIEDDSPYSPTKHQDELGVGVLEVKVTVKSVACVQISRNVSDEGIHSATTDTIVSDNDSKSFKSGYSGGTSLSERTSVDPTNAWKEYLPFNGTAEGTQPTNVQELTESSTVDGDGGGEVALNEFDAMLQAKEDRKRYSVFDKEDYDISDGVLFCNICEKNIYSINPAHMKSKAHYQSLREAFMSPTKNQDVQQTRGWQVTENGLLSCYLCLRDFKIRARHCTTDTHILLKKYKTCPRIAALKPRIVELWKNLPTTIFDGLFTLRLGIIEDWPAEASFCVACDQCFDTHADRTRHERESEKHRLFVEMVRQHISDLFSYSFGILPTERIKLGHEFRYCVLCKIGMTNRIELDNHVHGANSQHSKRVRLFWTKAIPELLESDLSNVFPHPVKDTASYELDVPQHKQLYYFQNLLHVIVISTDGYSMCSLCDEYVCDLSMKEHCASVMHAYMLKYFLTTLRDPDKRYHGLIRKQNSYYCVLCHVAYSNKTELIVHGYLVKPHLERVKLFHENFEPFIKFAVRCLNYI